MPTFRYEGTQQNGTPIFGTMDALSEPALRSELAARGVRMLQSNVQNVDASLGTGQRNLPRLYQLRVGERLREAILTGIPAHDAIRAMAAEPFQHPLLALMPWLLLLGCLAMLPAVGWSVLVPHSYLPLIILGLMVFVLLPAVWLISWITMDYRPRKLLHSLAGQMESGDTRPGTTMWGLPNEVRSIMHSQVDDHKKALAVADIVPALMGVRFHQQRFLLSIVGAMAFSMLMFLGLYVVMWQIVPQFKSIFNDFDTELPLMTLVLVQFSDMFAAGGLTGFLGCLVACMTGVVLLYFSLTTGRVAEMISQVPVFGLPIRWLMQARVARVLSSMLRYDADRAEALQAATAASSFQSVQRGGKLLAEGLRAGRGITGQVPELSGLPLSLLAVQPQRQLAPSNSSAVLAAPHELPGGSKQITETSGKEWSSLSIAENFSTLAQLLEQASHGHGRFLGVVLQHVITVLAGLIVGYVVIAMFLPLIKLLNDLS